MSHPSLIATLSTPPSPDGAELTALSDAVEWLEVRADLLGDIDPDWLRSHFKGRLLYALRTPDVVLNRLERLKTAARFYDRVELEAERIRRQQELRLDVVEAAEVRREEGEIERTSNHRETEQNGQQRPDQGLHATARLRLPRSPRRAGRSARPAHCPRHQTRSADAGPSRCAGGSA